MDTPQRTVLIVLSLLMLLVVAENQNNLVNLTGNAIADIGKESPVPHVPDRLIVSPVEGQVVSPFTASFDFPAVQFQCYYVIKENDRVTYDRRNRNCPPDVAVSADRCAPGTSCTISVESYGRDGRQLMSDSVTVAVQ